MTYQIREITNPHQDPLRRPCVKTVERSQPASASPYCPHMSLADEVWRLMQFDLYRPELHYMRGPGPKWRAKHDRTFTSLDDAIGFSRNDSECCAPGQPLLSPVLNSSYTGIPTLTMNADAVSGANEARRDISLSAKRTENMILQTFRSWPNATFAAICAAGVLCVLLLLSIATSLIAISSSSANAEPPGQACVAISEGEYNGAYRKNLLLTRFGTYERVKHFGQYSYWYCR